MKKVTRRGLGVVDGRFSLLILTQTRRVIAAAPIVVSPGNHFTQVNGLAPIRAALRLLFDNGISALFHPGTRVRTSVGRFEIIDPTLFYRFQKCSHLRETVALAQKSLSSQDLQTVDVVNEKYIGTVSNNRRNGEYMRLTEKTPNGF